MGGKQDTSVNVGRGPYCYRLHGENYHLAGPLLPADGKPAKFAQVYIFDTENEIQNRIGAVRQYNLPTASEVAALIVGDFDSTEHKRDITLHCQDGDFKRISELHPSYLALHYLLFFPYGEDNYRSDIFHEGQFIVDAFTMIESERLTFNCKNDNDLRSETYSKLATLAHNSDFRVKLRGKKVILNSNFTRSPRYMIQNYLDTMTLCKFYGYPDLFITFTCNPNWPVITRFMEKRGLKSEDCPDVISRVFKIKLDCLMKELKDGHIFGRVKGVYRDKLLIDDSGYALFKRRYDGIIIKKRGMFGTTVCGAVNPGLLRIYVSMGSTWRIYGFEIHFRDSSVDSKFMGNGRTICALYLSLPNHDKLFGPGRVLCGKNMDEIAEDVLIVERIKAGYPRNPIRAFPLELSRATCRPGNLSLATSRPGNIKIVAGDSVKCCSDLWEKCTVLRLTVNMRLGSGSTESEKKEIQEFADWILEIGNGKVGGANDGESTIVFIDNMLIPETDDDVGAIIDNTYPNFLQNLWNPSFFQEKAILAPTHEMVDIINERMLSLLLVFLNSLRMSGIPNHSIKLKIGTPIMLMCNINQRAGLCNGARLQVLRLGINILEAQIISGGSVGTICAIPRKVISLTDTKMPFKLNRRQFPIQVCFAITINKSQGQTLSQVGLFLRRPIFSYGQLYVAVSRVKSKKGLKVLCSDKDENYSNSTSNVVYKEILVRI
ncbi:ATP-dependent DNA helicase PIF1-like protein [Tanacetum coccineum]